MKTKPITGDDEMSEKLICQGIDGPCDRPAKKQRQNTMYTDDSKNWVTMCEECAKYNDERWGEMWNEYRTDIGNLNEKQNQ